MFRAFILDFYGSYDLKNNASCIVSYYSDGVTRVIIITMVIVCLETMSIVIVVEVMVEVTMVMEVVVTIDGGDYCNKVARMWWCLRVVVPY